MIIRLWVISLRTILYNSPTYVQLINKENLNLHHKYIKIMVDNLLGCMLEWYINGDCFVDDCKCKGGYNGFIRS